MRVSAAERLLTVMCASFVPSSTTGVDWATESCPKAAVVDLTEKTPDSSGTVYISDEACPWEAIKTTNDRKFSCLCRLKMCLWFRCAESYHPTTMRLRCIDVEYTFVDEYREMYERNDLHSISHEPCSANDSMNKNCTLCFESYFDYRRNVSLDDNVPKYNRCSESDPIVAAFGVCNERQSDNLLVWFLVCAIIAVLFMLMTFIVYSVIPKLKNLHGSIFRCYLASYISCMILFMIYASTNAMLSDFVTITYVASFFGFSYFGFATLLWLNVMSFNVWRTFRKFRPTGDINNLDVKNDERRKFVLYSIYAWCIPGIHNTLFFTVLITYSRTFGVSVVKSIFFYYPIALVVGTAISNAWLYILTAMAIKKHKKETTQVVDGVNKHHQASEQWFNLYVKLFILMGGPAILWGLALYLRIQMFWIFVYVIEALQGISVCYIFVWKDDVKRLIRERFDGTLRSFFRRNLLPTIQQN